jgi:DNA-binding CsgD family transcriptional regulator
MIDAYTILVDAAVEVGAADPRKAIAMLYDAAEAAGWASDHVRMAEAAQHATELTPGDDPELVYVSKLLRGLGTLWGGKSADAVPLILEALEHADELTDEHWLLWAASGAWTIGNADLSSELLARAEAMARESGAVDVLAKAQTTSTLHRFFAGRPWLSGDAYHTLELTRAAGMPNAAVANMAVLAWFAGQQGKNDECRTYAAEVAAATRASGDILSGAIAEWGVALLDLALGRADETVSRFTADPSRRHPFIGLMSATDLVEAAVRAGRDDVAAAAIAELEGFVASGAVPAWAEGNLARCRGLAADGDEAEALFAEALQRYGDVDRFDRARTHLLYGELLRRRRQRSEAREHLRTAADAFDRLGATPWEERAHSELRATGETARRRDPSTVAQLTPQELQISQLVARGHSNKEVAAQLFLSPRTVEYHLRKVFSKLGITSRAELIRQGIAEPEQVLA